MLTGKRPFGLSIFNFAPIFIQIVLIYQCSLLNTDSKLKHNVLSVDERMSCKVLEMIFLSG